jgi:hypothetical protein
MRTVQAWGRRGAAVAVVAAVASAMFVSPGLRAEDEGAKDAGEPARIGEELIGTWVLASTAAGDDRPEVGTRLKFFTGKHWAITQADKEGRVIFHHGGDYSIDGDEYTETIRYANDNTASMIGDTYKFKMKLDGDKYTQVGQGNPYTEDWKRAE